MPLNTCLYFVTLRCNATCEFCEIWRRNQEEEITEAEISTVLPKLREARIKGAKKLVVTGGEPLLRDDLPEILKAAKNLGFYIELTTNGLEYPDKGKDLTGLIDRLLFALDYPIASEHDRSRGIECFGEVIRSIKLAKELGEKPLINFTLTRDSVRFLPEMLDLSEKLKVLVNLDPVYDFHGTQGFEPATNEHIKYYGKKKNFLVNLALLEFIKAGGNRTYLPRCRAKETTHTILPDGSLVAPCIFNPGGKQGGEAVCSSCMRSPYMLPSFAMGLDKYFWLNLYSDFINQRRTKV